jgi:SulP family sulfate permease
MIQPHEDRVSLAPFLPVWRSYTREKARLDFLAGLTVAIFAVPQAMAYAVLAGLPPVHGLYAAIGMSIVAALWGGSAFSNAGPTNSASLLTASALLPFVKTGDLESLVWQFTLLVGLMRIAFGMLRLGQLTAFVPEAAVVGAMSGAGILIALGPLNQLLGVASSTQHNFLARTLDVLARAGQANMWALTIGIGTAAVMWSLEKAGRQSAKWKRLPAALVAMVAATLASQAVAARGASISSVRDLGAIPLGLPPLQAYSPDWSLTSQLLPGAFAVAVIGLIEATSIAQVLAMKKREHFNANQEFFGQGLGQIAGAFCSGLPGSSSFSRSALIEACGAQTRFANVFFGVCTALFVAVGAKLLESIPVSALAGLLIYSGFKLVDTRALKRVWDTDRRDAIVLAVTLGTTVFVKIEYGFFVGTVAAMILFLQRARDLQLYELLPCFGTGTAKFDEVPYKEGTRHERSDVVALSLHGDLFFALSADLREQLNEILRVQQPKFVVIRTRRAHSIDSGCWSAIFDFARALHESGGQLFLTGIRPELRRIVEEAGMGQVLRPHQLIAPDEAPWASFDEGLARVRGQLDWNSTLPEPWLKYFRPTYAAFDAI